MLKKIEDLENRQLPLSYMNGYEKLTMDEMEKIHLKTFEYKKLLEDKAKTSLFSVTISITLIFTFTNLLLNIQYFRTLIIFLVLYAIINMILAGKMAFDANGELNVFSELFPEDLHQKKKNKKEILAYATESNVNYNIVRNNHVYLSYKSIILSLSTIALVGILYIYGNNFDEKKPDKQEELLNKLNSNSVKIEKTLKEMNDTINKLNTSIINGTSTQSKDFKDLAKLLTEDIKILIENK